MDKYVVVGMDTEERFLFLARTPYVALKKLIYTLNLSHLDDTAKIEKTESGTHLYTVHNGNIYAIRNLVKAFHSNEKE